MFYFVGEWGYGEGQGGRKDRSTVVILKEQGALHFYFVRDLEIMWLPLSFDKVSGLEGNLGGLVLTPKEHLEINVETFLIVKRTEGCV